MAEPRELKESPAEGAEAPSRPSRKWIPLRNGGLEGDHTVHRAALYFFVFLLLFVLAAGPTQSAWRSSSGVHEILETVATLLAFVVGALALVRFYSKKRGTFLFIGTGFLGTGILDLFHVLISSGVGQIATPLEIQDRSLWSFTASGAYLSIFLFVSWMAWRQESKGGPSEVVREGPVYITAVSLATLIFIVFNVFPVTQAFYPDSRISAPAEFFPALFFLLALGGYLLKGHWRLDAFEHWLVLALLIAFMSHGAFMPFASEFHGADFDTAHILKVLSYLSVLAGLMASVFITFRREEEASLATREANAALAREIDVRRKAERILQESEERLQDFLDNAHDLIQSVDPEGRFLYVNRAWQEVLGYSEKDLRDLTFFDILDDSCRERCAADFAAVLEGGDTLPGLEVNFRTADGRLVTCMGSANARLKDGRAVATRSIFRDVTESLQARRDLEAFQANLQALVENTGDAIWSVNRELSLLTFNTAFSMALEARTGVEPEPGGSPDAIFPEEDAHWYGERYQRALLGEAFSELRDEEIGGQIRSYELFFNPIREALGITGVAVFSKDVTARRRTQMALRMAKEEAERANQAKSQFLANMSHELRTPLNSVIGFTNILLKNRSGNLVKQELGFLERISANGKHLLELINEVLDLAKIEAGRMELDLQMVDLDALIRETLAQMEGQVRGKKVVLRAQVPPGLPPLEADAGKLKQVIINLVGNALKFTEEGEVAVEVAVQDDEKTVSNIAVRDTGIGIPQDRLQAIFEAFQQADGTTSRRFGGTGLGLTISRSLCQLMGYDMKVESEVGKGSAFTILMFDLPDSPKRPEDELMEEALKPLESSRPGKRRAAPPPQAPATALKHRVLVIDDDPDSRVLMTHFLEDIGCEVETAPSAHDGILKARADRPDLITLDLMMPGVTGWEALRQIKEDPDLRDIPVVIVSMLAGEGEKANLLGAVDLLNKPVERSDLLRVLQRNLEGDGGRTVLVVDDDRDTRTVIRQYLEDAGLQVLEAADGKEAEAVVLEAVPDIILLDLVMPGMDGVTFLSRLRENREQMGLPVIICTGKELTREERNRLQAQASGIVAKGEGFEENLKRLIGSFFPLNESPDQR